MVLTTESLDKNCLFTAFWMNKHINNNNCVQYQQLNTSNLKPSCNILTEQLKLRLINLSQM